MNLLKKLVKKFKKVKPKKLHDCIERGCGISSSLNTGLVIKSNSEVSK